ncbi:hypothetical protein CCC_03884 [Paramagnetospirillum magnetotacticum MS-1]|uniref:Uncharacterized protein n=1 Tax=Paramagnetospirillum magnetotacticum MS-1 TaxID=272627 RepID=A0A0C2UDY5_PARME|nr:hypothetical protein CCC_03884 [Paramagnetospirillum magnetotacticum MS-1]
MDISGGYIFDLFMEMEDWLKRHCKAPFAISRYDEVKFTHRQDAEVFARKWFETGRWQLQEIKPSCPAGRCHAEGVPCPA